MIYYKYYDHKIYGNSLSVDFPQKESIWFIFGFYAFLEENSFNRLNKVQQFGVSQIMDIRGSTVRVSEYCALKEKFERKIYSLKKNSLFCRHSVHYF